MSRRLAAEGAEVYGLDLKPPRAEGIFVRHIEQDVRNLNKLYIPNLDQIFNLAAVHTTPGHPDNEYYDTNVLGAIEIVKFASRNDVRQITFTSSISVYGPSEEIKSETSSTEPVSAYGKSKFMAEEIHRAWASATPGAKLTVIRPAVVFGAGEGGNFTRMAMLLKKGFFIFPGRRDTIKSCIFVDHLIDLMLEAGKGKASYDLINGSYVERPSLEMIIESLKSQSFPNAQLYDVPSAFVTSAAKILSLFQGLGLGIHPDRVTKLLKSTNITPGWAIANGLLKEGDFLLGLKKWSETTNGTYI